jgi:hypothetical protein
MARNTELDPTKHKSPPMVLIMQIGGKRVGEIKVNGWLALRFESVCRGQRQATR